MAKKNNFDEEKKAKKEKKPKKEKIPKKEKPAKKSKLANGKKGKQAKKVSANPQNNANHIRVIMGPGATNLGLTKRSPMWKIVMAVTAYIFAHRRNLTIERVRTQNLKPPYILLCSHQSFADYLVVERAVTFHNDVNHLVEASEFANSETFMKNLGCIPLRRFSADGPLIYHIKETIMQKKIVAIYPEAHLSLDGTNSPLPDSLYKIIKTMRVPVVVLKLRGNYIAHPCWTKISNKNHIEAQFSQVLSSEEVDSLEPDEIGRKISTAFRYDDYWFQLQNNIKLMSKQRAEGLHYVLYLCPCCGVEFQMNTRADTLYCDYCQQEWTYTELAGLEPVLDSANQEILDELWNKKLAKLQKAFDDERIEQAQKAFAQSRRAYEYTMRKREEELAEREEIIREAHQRLDTPPEFEPLPPPPERPVLPKELPFIEVEMPPPEPLPDLSRVPKWYEYQRARVSAEVKSDTYRMEIPVTVEVLRDLSKDFIFLGEGHLIHNNSGFHLLYKEADGRERMIEKPPLTTYSLHVDFDYKNKGPFIDISTATETFYLYPRTSDCSVAKVALAAEEMYRLARKVIEDQILMRSSEAEKA